MNYSIPGSSIKLLSIYKRYSLIHSSSVRSLGNLPIFQYERSSKRCPDSNNISTASKSSTSHARCNALLPLEVLILRSSP